MIRYKRLLVGLGLDSYDHALIRYASLVSRMSHSEQVQFTHVFRGPRTTEVYFEELSASFKNPFERALRAMREDMDQEVGDLFEGPPGVDASVMLTQGDPLRKLLMLARGAESDLVVVGKDHDGGTLAEKLTRKAPCSVLIVPSEASPRVRRVMVPIDFSDHAADAVDAGLAFAEAAGLRQVHLVHVYSLPSGGYFELEHYPEREQQAVRRQLEQRYQSFVQALNLRGLTPTFHLIEHGDVARAVSEQANTLGADLVVMGTRGRSDSAAILMGSVAEQMVRHTDIPLVAVKRKGATLTLLSVLFGHSTNTEDDPPPQDASFSTDDVAVSNAATNDLVEEGVTEEDGLRRAEPDNGSPSAER